MKTVKIKSYVLFCITTVLYGCNTNEELQKGDCNVLLFDLTDSMTSVKEFDVAKIKSFFTLNSDLNSSAYCAIAGITDMRYNPVSEYSIESKNPYEANSLERRRVKDTFFNSILIASNKLKSSKIGKSKSYVCYAISHAVELLNKCQQCNQKRIIVISDMMENTNVFSVFDKKQSKILASKPTQLYPLLDKKYPIINAENIELFIIHQPKNQKKDEMYYKVSAFFRDYYESKGLRVHIETSIQNQIGNE